MDDLIPSNAGADSAELQRRLALYGYLYFPAVLPQADVYASSQELASIFREGGWIDADGDAIRPTAAVAQQETDATYRRAALSAALHRVPFFDGLQDLVECILGEPAFPYPSKVLRATPPAAWTTESGRYTHHDFAYWGVDDMLTTWIPLVNVPKLMGGLALLPGSHRQSPQPLRRLGPDEPGWATTDYGLGDVVLFHCLTGHAALPNLSGGLRLSGDFRWQATTTPVRREFVYGRRGGAKELFTKSFSDAPWWRSVPGGLTYVDVADGTIRRPGASRFFEVHPAWASWPGPTPPEHG